MRGILLQGRSIPFVEECEGIRMIKYIKVLINSVVAGNKRVYLFSFQEFFRRILRLGRFTYFWSFNIIKYLV